MFTRILSVIVVLTVSSTCLADSTCQETLQACDGAYQSQRILIKDLKDQVGNLAQKTILQDRIIQDQKSVLDDPLKDPVKVGLGAAAITVVLLLATGHLK